MGGGVLTRKEMLIAILGEEGVEVAQRVFKIQRFTLEEIQDGQELDNAQRLQEEVNDFYTAAVMAGFTPSYSLRKALKVEKYLELSKQLGTLQDEVKG